VSVDEVQHLIGALRSGELTLDEVAARFKARRWPDTAVTEPQSYLELAAAAQRDPEPDVPGSFDEVTAAYDRGEITREQYRTLAHAVAEAINAEARRGAAE
jgi:hypothetical protein